MPYWYLQQASTFAGDVDNLVLLITVIVGFWFLAAEFIFFWLIWRFRARDGHKAAYVAGETKREKRWVSYPHYAVLAFDILILIFALRVWNDIKISAPPAEERIRVIAQQWAWTFVHAGPDGVLDTADDIRTVDDMHVELDKTYHFELHSRDVVHSFSVPVFRLKQDAVPGRAILGWFRPTRTGEFDIQCAEICGIGHGLMPARLIVRTPEEHRAWMAEASGMASATAGTGLVARVEGEGQ
ncbi:MAG: cytochrome c oxidase subunit II [Acidobacteriota bacterium]|jgi:cytochrome c oxidase subunit 2|nr:MAG: cytochrome C oxidase subunit II [Acidobacteriota bacterium]